MIKKNNFFYKKAIIFFSFCLLLINYYLFNFLYIYGMNEERNDNINRELLPLVNKKNNKPITLNKINNNNLVHECKYQLNKQKKYDCLYWKHDLGSLFSKKVRLFYGIPDVKKVPCMSFQEWLNLKQFLYALFNYHIPKLDFLFNLIDFFHLKEEFIDEKYDRIALDSIHFCRLLKKTPSLGCFYFEEKDLNLIDFVNISFCNCKISGYSVLELIQEIFNLNREELDNFLKHLFQYLNYLNEEFDDNHKKNSEKVFISIDKFLEEITKNNDNIDDLDKSLLFHLIKNLVHHFFSESFLINFDVEQNNIYKKPLKECKMKLRFSQKHKTVGFLLEIQYDEEQKIYLCFYEIFRNKINNIEKIKLIEKILISYKDKENSIFLNHLLINFSKSKKFFNKKVILFGADIKEIV
ncbi:hypothetical protein AXA84_0367 [Candidatus Phytoplasma oryzae]|uniref:Uncharacterized protein n=1 Tax=Candidatus Phytoplasma oryzae TaxID=203274 RepID=A0A139JQ84_9MOLU|nr:hypothetical protein [Candidatus Phytoplasma oryzae]KXT29131.1 hypothetical protein AXA84_0367 [Candidatus Phytoplasma oryzae]RAM57551.1 hypothetical protein DH96_02415 [Candidatus Phytoplasma oryzae]